MPTLHLQDSKGVPVGTAEVDDVDDLARGIIDEAFRTVVVEIRDDGSLECRECDLGRDCKHEQTVDEALEEIRERPSTP